MTFHAEMAMPDKQLYLLNLCLIKFELMFIVKKAAYFPFGFLYKRDLRISTAEKHTGIIRIKLFLNRDNRQYIPHYRSDKSKKGTVVNQALPSLN